MKKFSVVVSVIATAVLLSCQKQQTEEERNAEIDRKVQERLAAEQQTQQQQQLAQRQADLDAREKALAEKENATAAATPAQTSEQSETTMESRPRAREPRERSMSVGYSTFYNKLESYGDWIETGDYGYVFHPREAQSSRWRPYTDGRWVYTDAGWTWISEEPFGWATYHYGRWTRLRGIGWVWVPGNQWAPAWVSWRKSPDYVGWAPLPPEARFDQRTGIHNWSDNYYDVGPDQYCFVASREFGAPRVQQTLLPSERSVTIVNQTTNVTNITYNNTTIVNEGPSYDELRSISREPVQRYRLERNVNVDIATGAPRSEVRGETVVIAAPVIAAPVANERPSAVKQTIATATVDLGWAAIANQEEAKRTRQKMKSEATPPPNAPSKKFVKSESTTTATIAPATTATATPVSTTAASATTAPAMTPGRAPTAASTVTAYPTSSPLTSPTPSQRRGRLLIPDATPTPHPSATVAARSAPIATPHTAPSSSPVASATVPSRTSPPPPESSPSVTGQPPPAQARGKLKSQTQQFQPRKVEQMPSASPSTTAAPPQSKGGGKGKGVKAPNEAASILPSATPVKQFSPRSAAPMPSASPSIAAAPPQSIGGGTGKGVKVPHESSLVAPHATPTPVTPSAVSPPAASVGEKLTRQEKKEQKREQKQEMKHERTGGTGTASPSPTP